MVSTRSGRDAKENLNEKIYEKTHLMNNLKHALIFRHLDNVTPSISLKPTLNFLFTELL